MLCAAAIPHTYEEDNVETEDLKPCRPASWEHSIKQQRLHAKQSGRLLEKKGQQFLQWHSHWQKVCVLVNNPCSCEQLQSNSVGLPPTHTHLCMHACTHTHTHEDMKGEEGLVGQKKISGR